MSASRRGFASLVVALVLVGPGAAGLADRFGPDGIPFTFDDPLAVGASAAPVRYGAYGADACSDEAGLAEGIAAHGHGGSHPTGVGGAAGLATHRSRATPVEEVAAMQAAGTLEAPFDLTAWVAAVELDAGTVRRHRILPEDSRWTDEASERAHPTRGWVDGWTAEETGPGSDMNRVAPAGERARNLHLGVVGTSYRDVKAETGFASGLWWESLRLMKNPILMKHIDKFKRLDVLLQQVYSESTVVELTNLDTLESGVSGNFVADVAGTRQVGLQDWTEEHMGGMVTVSLKGFPTLAGGPISQKATLAMPPGLTAHDYYLAWPVPYPDPAYQGKTIFDVMFDQVEILFLGMQIPPDLARPMAKLAAADEFAELDRIADLTPPDSYRVISTYSGLAGGPGGDDKNPFDRVALGYLEKGGQFKPVEWLKWRHLGAQPIAGLLHDEEAEARVAGSLGPLADSRGALAGLRYNSGSTFLARSSMTFGNSAARDPTENPYDLLVPPGKTGAAALAALADGAALREDLPDILESMGKRWLYVRLDGIDPHAFPEAEGAAAWRSEDALFPHPEARRPVVRVDWPPPNFHFGRGQLEVFRTGSGGVPRAGDGAVPGPGTQAPDVELASVMTWQGLVCIDPVERTYSISGVGLRQGAGGAGAVRIPAQVRPGVHLGWTAPRPLAQLPAGFGGGSRRRWLQAAANHHGGAGATLGWGMDFECDGRLDSGHAQHMSEVGTEPYGAVFGIEAGTGGGGARTGFRFVAMD